METGVLVALVGAVTAFATLLLRQFIAPFFSPWYEERLRKAQARVGRRASQRLMIENELEKGFEDLSTVRVMAVADRFGQPRLNSMQSIGEHESRWGVWRPYLIEDEELLELCEEYRTLIRELRVAAFVSDPDFELSADEIDEREKEVGAAMSSKAREIATAMNKRGW